MKAGVDYIGITTPFYCNDGKGRFLLHRRSDKCRDEKGTWDFGSGQLEFGETPEESALREAEEEYGIKGEIQEQLPAHSILRDQSGVKTHWLAVPFFIKMDIKKAKITEPEKATAIGIFSLDDLPQPLHTGVILTMSLYKGHFDRYCAAQQQKIQE